MEAVKWYEKNPSPNINEAGVLEKLIKINKNIGIAMAEEILLAAVDTTSTAVTSVLYRVHIPNSVKTIFRARNLVPGMS